MTAFITAPVTRGEPAAMISGAAPDIPVISERFMRTFSTYLAYAFRALRRNPAFTLTAIATLALGIGATTAIFSVTNAVLLKPMPYPDADRLVLIWTELRARGVKDFPLAPGDYPELREQATHIEEMAAAFSFQQPLRSDGAEPEQVSTTNVTTNLLSMLGAQIAVGRNFIPEDGAPQPQPPDGAQQQGQQVAPAGPPPLPQIVILSNDLWKRRYGSDPDIVGKRIDLGFGGAQVVGVLAPGFRLLWPPGTGVDAQSDVYSAARFNFATASRINVSLRVIGRVKPGVPLSSVNEQLERIASGLREQFPIKKTAGVNIAAQKMHDDLVADVRPAIMTLLGAVAFVLLIACANVANLLLVRTAARERELAVRAALGGSRLRIALPLLAEVAILAVVGASIGLLLAQSGMSLLISLAPANLPRLADVRLDTTVLAFTIGTTFVAALIFGVMPALRSARPNLTDALRSGRSATSVSGKRLRHTVVVAEVALAFVLLVGGGLLMRSFMELQRAEPGFEANNLLTFEAALQSPDAGAHVAFTQQLSDRLRALPGVVGVTAAGPLPLTGGVANARWGTEAAAADPSAFQQADVRAVLPGYFEVMGTRIIDGRVFTDADNNPDSKTIVVDRVLAAKAFPNESAVGKRLLVRIRSNEPELLEVAGVVDHQRNETLAADGREAIYVTSGFLGFGAANQWAVRLACSGTSPCDPTSLTPAIRRAVGELSPRTPVSSVQTMEGFVEQSMASTRFALLLIAAFAIVAALLACVGLYGVLATTVRQRTTELGVRLALGASRASVFRLVVGEGLSLTVAGLVFGLVVAFAVTRVMQSMLVGIAPTDPVTFTIVTLLFVVVAALSCWFPARRAARLDPMTALRSE